MIAMTRDASPRATSRPTRVTFGRSLLIAAGVALVPKCAWCVFVYLVTGAAIFSAAPEFCGGTATTVPTLQLAIAAGTFLVAFAVLRRSARCARDRSRPSA